MINIYFNGENSVKKIIKKIFDCEIPAMFWLTLVVYLLPCIVAHTLWDKKLHEEMS